MSANENNLRENKLGTGSVRRLVLGMSFPAMLSMIISAMYNIVDAIFVGRISYGALTAVTLVFPVQMFLVALGVGTNIGLSSLIARRLGQKRQEDADSAASHGFLIAIFNWLIFALFGLFLADRFIGLFTDDPYIFANAIIYCRIISIGSLFAFVSICCEKILQATGNMVFPMIFNISGAVLNIVLAPIFIIGLFGAPRLEVMGAGLVAITGQFVAMVLALILTFRFKHYVNIRLRGFRVDFSTLKDIYAVGVPTIIMMAIGSLMNTAFNKILMDYSAAAVAVLGVYFRINSFLFMPLFGLNQGSLPVIAYNYGARNKERLLLAYKTAVFIAVGIMAVGTAIFLLIPGQLISLFNDAPEMLAVGVPAMRIISICFVSAAFSIVTGALFQALAHGTFTMLVALVRQLLVAVPAMYIFLRLFGIDAAWASFPFAELFGLTMTIIFLRRIYIKEIRPL